MSSLFRSVNQHLIWLILGKRSLKCGGDCCIGFCVFLNMFPWRSNEEKPFQQHGWELLVWISLPREQGLCGSLRHCPQMTYSQQWAFSVPRWYLGQALTAEGTSLFFFLKRRSLGRAHVHSHTYTIHFFWKN